LFRVKPFFFLLLLSSVVVRIRFLIRACINSKEVEMIMKKKLGGLLVGTCLLGASLAGVPSQAVAAGPLPEGGVVECLSMVTGGTYKWDFAQVQNQKCKTELQGFVAGIIGEGGQDVVAAGYGLWVTHRYWSAPPGNWIEVYGKNQWQHSV
jgi:hypothetical protein